MNNYFAIPFVCWAVMAIIMSLVWLWALKLKNNGVVDIFWAFNFTIISIIIWLMADGFLERKALVCTLAGLWSLRLGIYLLIRVGGHIHEEEGRYKKLREEWSNAKFFLFFQSQAFSNVMLAIPFFVISLNPSPVISSVECIGAGLWLVCIIGEGVSDWQLQQFKKQAQNKGKVCEYGLWNYSRHPNYFFQFSMWIAVLIFSLPSPFGWLAVICPLSIGYLIFKVTGIPMTEEQAVRSKGDAYRDYQRSTSAFIPWFKKK